ncbi:MAG: serine/threonine-protein kinase [Planctomycetota bacterium]
MPGNDSNPSTARTRRMLELLRLADRRGPEAREETLRSACADEPDLLRDVLAMIHGDEEQAGLFGETNIAAGRSLVGRVFDDARESGGAGEILPLRLGAYTLTRLLGEGSMGAVYHADGPQGPVAVKVIHPHLLSTPGFLERFLREASIGQQVQHENVVRTSDCGSEPVAGRPRNFLVMEYVEGQTLRDLIHELQRVPEELCRHVGREVARGLSAIHEARVIHRDLKPENVLITPEHVVKVMDLGVARLQDEAIRLSHAGDFLGSLEYAAPEQFGAGGEPDGRADLYALGVLLYELSTGQHPYRDENASKLVCNILDADPRRAGEVNPQLSPFLEETVHTLLAKDRAQRFASAAAVATILDEGEQSDWWLQRARVLRRETKRPLRRIRIPRETALYGRDADLAQLQALFERAKAGDGQVLLIEGEAGVGKTRLVDEFVGRLRQAGEDVNFVFGSYPPGGAATASGAFSEAYREQFGAEGLEEALAGCLVQTPVLVPAFAALLRGESPPSGVQALTKDSLQTVFVHATRGLAAERTTIVLIDDLHFAPEEGRALFSSLGMAVPGHRVLLLGTTRPGLPQHWIADVERLDQAGRAELSRLGPRDLAELLEDAFRSERLARELGHRIAVKSDGNPFFAFEIVQGLREGQFISQAPDGTWVTTRQIEEIEVPSSVTDLVHARVGDLSDEERIFLDVASCLGFRFDAGVVAEVLGTARIPALQMLGRIEKRHRLVRAVGDGFVFDHHQVQEALYGGLSNPLREEYHAAIAAVLEEREGAAVVEPAALDGALCVALCEHHLRGRKGGRALRYLDAALGHLEAGFLNDRALALADRALEVPDLLAGAARLDVLLRKNARLQLLGRREEQEPVIAAARALADDANAEAKVQVESGTLLSSTGHYTEAQQEFERSLAFFQKNGDRPGEAALTTSLGRVFLALGQYEEAQARFARALLIARELGDRPAEGAAMGNLGSVLHALGRHEEARLRFEQDLAISREVGNRLGEAGATGNLGNVLYALGRYDEAQASYEQSLAISREIGNRHGEAITTGGLGSLFQTRGRYAQALTQSNRYLAMAREIGQRSSEAVALVNIGPLWSKLGEPALAREALEAAVDLCRRIGARYAEGYALRALGDVAEAEGDRRAALGFADEALALRRETGHGDGVADSLIQLGEIQLLAGEIDAAREAAREALDLFREQQRSADVAHAAALLACLPEGDVGLALAAFDEAGESANTPQVRHLLWKATRDRAHIEAAKQLLDELVRHAPEEYRESMVRNVGLHRDIMRAWEETGGDGLT